MKNRMKIKFIKAECPICKVTGSIQLFFNKDGNLRYARTRHFNHIDKDSRKPQFTYCKIEDLVTLQSSNGSIGQVLGQAIIRPTAETFSSKQNLDAFNNNSRVAGGVGFEPTTPNLGGWCSIRYEPLRRQYQPHS